jgi:hypothetical protein
MIGDAQCSSLHYLQIGLKRIGHLKRWTITKNTESNTNPLSTTRKEYDDPFCVPFWMLSSISMPCHYARGPPTTPAMAMHPSLMPSSRIMTGPH